jgi:hypothetical protein
MGRKEIMEFEFNPATMTYTYRFSMIEHAMNPMRVKEIVHEEFVNVLSLKQIEKNILDGNRNRPRFERLRSLIRKGKV